MVYIVLALVALWVFGPRPQVKLKWNARSSRMAAAKSLDAIKTADLKQLRQQISDIETQVPGLIDRTEKSIVFSSESRPKRTDYCVLYIHGFSATRQEISPVPENIAKSLHANYYALA